MGFIDVLFPLNLGPLTYKLPVGPGGIENAPPGTLVKARIKNALKKGVVLGPTVKPPEGELKEIEGVLGGGPIVSRRMLQLISWMAGHYFAKEGMALKNIFPTEFWALKKYETKSNDEVARAAFKAVYPMAEAVKQNALDRYYKAYLLHAPDTAYEMSFMLDAASGLRNLIVLCPDRKVMGQAHKSLTERFGDRVVLYHSGLKVSEKKNSLQRIIGGASDIVVGGRFAVFAPLREVSLICVMREESTTYKEEGGIRYNARDMAVMRGYLESASVLLSSVCPSVESYHNAGTGKYRTIDAPRPFRPRARVIDMRKTRVPISFKLRFAAQQAVKRGGRALFIANRKGYSFLKCPACERMETCARCGIPLEYYRREKLLKCRYCGAESPPPETCPSCGGLLDTVGAGVERVEEELKSIGTVGVWADKGQGEAPGEEGLVPEDEERLIVGTRKLSKGAEGEKFALAAFINADSYLNAPDFRATEKAMRDAVYMAEKVAANGEIFFQTRNPGAPFFRHVRNFDLKGFYREELGLRKELNYPPFSRMALITADVEFEAIVSAEEIEALGPVPSLAKRGKKVWKLLIKAPSKKALESAVKSLMKKNEEIKLRVDVDPAAF